MAKGMEEIDLRSYTFGNDLFELFCTQLKKDFESAGADGSFVDRLVPDWPLLRQDVLVHVLRVSANDHLLRALLYRIDLSETTVRSYGQTHPELPFAELLTELIVKRILQKVILKKRFSSN